MIAFSFIDIFHRIKGFWSFIKLDVTSFILITQAINYLLGIIDLIDHILEVIHLFIRPQLTSNNFFLDFFWLIFF